MAIGEHGSISEHTVFFLNVTSVCFLRALRIWLPDKAPFASQLRILSLSNIGRCFLPANSFQLSYSHSCLSSHAPNDGLQGGKIPKTNFQNPQSCNFPDLNPRAPRPRGFGDCRPAGAEPRIFQRVQRQLRGLEVRGAPNMEFDVVGGKVAMGQGV